MDALTSAQNAIGVVFKDRSLLAEALTHASYTNENPELGPVTNEAAADGYGLGFMVLCRRQVPSDGSTA